jgi:hypothetical protein
MTGQIKRVLAWFTFPQAQSFNSGDQNGTFYFNLYPLTFILSPERFLQPFLLSLKSRFTQQGEHILLV